ncbi:MAG: hypothetical protein ACR2OO_12255, partial [Thermomicrobiales bacterium]
GAVEKSACSAGSRLLVCAGAPCGARIHALNLASSGIARARAWRTTREAGAAAEGSAEPSPEGGNP